MSTQTAATETVKSSGIKDADEFAAQARELGLDVKVKITNSEPVYFRDGKEMLPAVLNVCVVVNIPVPESVNDTALGLAERCNTLYSYWTKRQSPRARGRWVQGSHSTLGHSEDMHVKHRVVTRLEGMARDLQMLQKLAQD
jgi:hypothetical protein